MIGAVPVPQVNYEHRLLRLQIINVGSFQMTATKTSFLPTIITKVLWQELESR